MQEAMKNAGGYSSADFYKFVHFLIGRPWKLAVATVIASTSLHFSGEFNPNEIPVPYITLFFLLVIASIFIMRSTLAFFERVILLSEKNRSEDLDDMLSPFYLYLLTGLFTAMVMFMLLAALTHNPGEQLENKVGIAVMLLSIIAGAAHDMEWRYKARV